MYRVGDDKDVGFGSRNCYCFGEVSHDRCIGIEKICQYIRIFLAHPQNIHTITSHPRLSRYTRRDKNYLSSLERVLQAGLLARMVADDIALCVDMANIGSNT